MHLTLIRHAEVDKKYHRCYNGHIDIKLSTKGQAQAKILAQQFYKQEFDSVYCSDLLRAKMTLKDFKHSKDAIYTSKLREKSWGKHEGLTYNEIIAQKEIHYINFLQWINSLDGEPYDKFIKRVEEFFLEFLPSQKKENILVITHSGVIKTLISIVEEISLEEAFSMQLDYASVIKLHYDNKTSKYGYKNENT